MASLPCPACGAPVEFRSAAPFAVCSHCQSLLLRRAATLESIGRVAEVPEDFSPLQLRAGGVFEGHRFALVGRLRKLWSEGSWNEWCAAFDGGQIGWLAEAQGDWVMTFERPLTSIVPQTPPAALASLTPGKNVAIDGKAFSVSDVKQVQCIGAEGELAENAIAGAATSIDLHGPRTAFATIEVMGQNAHLFVGRYVEFAECQFSGLRALGDWGPIPGSASR